MRVYWLLGGMTLLLSVDLFALDLSAMPPAETRAALMQWRAESACVDQRLETASDPLDCAEEFANVALLNARLGDLPDAERHWRRAIEWVVRDAADANEAWSEVSDLGFEAMFFLRSFALDNAAMRLIEETRPTMQQLGWAKAVADPWLDLLAFGPQIRSGQSESVKRRYRAVINALTQGGEAIEADQREDLISRFEQILTAHSPTKLAVADNAVPLVKRVRRMRCGNAEGFRELWPTRVDLLRADGALDAAIDFAIQDANEANPGSVNFQVIDLMVERYGEAATRAALTAAAAGLRSRTDGVDAVSSIALLGHQIQLVDVIETENGLGEKWTSRALTKAEQRAGFLNDALAELDDVLAMRSALPPRR
jgi:hypothetical protein